MRTRNWFLAFILATIPNFSFAKKAFVEPYLGLAKQEIHIESQAVVADSYGLGAKFGFFVNNKFYIGGDYMQAGPFAFGELLSEQEMTLSAFGAGIGLDYKIVRFWLGYYFDSSATIAANNSTLSGTGIKGGFGLVAGKKFRASLEVMHNTYTEYTASSNGTTTSITVPQDLDYKYITTLVTLSVPIDIK